MNKNIFRKNDIRGVYKKDFDLDFVKNLAFAFIRFYEQNSSNKKKQKNLEKGMPDKAQKPWVAVGHDCRLSSLEIAKCLIKSLGEAGAEVYFLGMVPSPVCFFASLFSPAGLKTKEIKASIMVTASHNPPDFNGFKMILNGKSLCGEKMLFLKKIMEEENLTAKARKKGSISPLNIKPLYLSFLKNRFQSLKSFSSSLGAKKISAKQQAKRYNKLPIKSIAVDCGNGVGGPLAEKIFKALNLPLKVYWLKARPDGRFLHHPPDPSKEKHLRALQKTIKEKHCDFGVAFDGDGDRLVILGKSGKIFHGDELMALFIADIFKAKGLDLCPADKKRQIQKNPGFKKLVTADLKCADWFFDFLKQNKIPFKLGPSGHALVREKALKEKAVFGGELAGHFFFMDDPFPIDDGLYGLLKLINICFKTGKDPEDLLKQTGFKFGEHRSPLSLKKNNIIPKNHNSLIKSFETYELRAPFLDRGLAKKQIKKLKLFFKKQKGAECCFIDGVRVSFPKKNWGLARLSTTQEEWTFRFGGKSKKDLKNIQNKFFKFLKIKPQDLS